MKKFIILVLVLVCSLFFVVYTMGCGSSSSSATTTTTTTAASTTTTTTTTTTTSTTSTSSTSTSTTTTTTTTNTTLDGLVAHYAFNDGAGTTATDSSSNDLNGEIVGASWVAGRTSGYALSFDGTSDYVQIPGTGEVAPSDIADLSVGSIAIWFKYEGTPEAVTGFLLPLFYQGPTLETDADRSSFIIEVGHATISPASKELFYTVTWTGSVEPILCFDNDYNLTAESWYHFVVTSDNAGGGNTGYLNGQELVDRVYNFGSASDGYFLSTVPHYALTFGKGRYAGSTEVFYFDGLIDDVQIYNRVLTPTEVLQLYQQ